jgi:uncharacterized protein (DUF433 family)
MTARERVHRPHSPIEPVVLEVLRQDLRQPAVLRVRPQVRIKPTELIRRAAPVDIRQALAYAAERIEKIEVALTGSVFARGIRGKRITVRGVLGILASYGDRAGISCEYPFLEEEDSRPALTCASHRRRRQSPRNSSRGMTRIFLDQGSSSIIATLLNEDGWHALNRR